MKKIYFAFCVLLFFATSLSAQKKKSYTVVAGTNVEETIPFTDRYRYPAFVQGKAIYKTGTFSTAKFNYNLLVGEMQYIQSKDTLSIANPDDIALFVVSNDTFFYNHGYLELLKGGKIEVAAIRKIEIQQVVKKDAYGNAGSSSAIESYGSLQSDGRMYKLIANEDRIFEEKARFFIAVSPNDFVVYTKKKVLQLFPDKKDAIQSYLKTNKTDFNSADDLLKLAGFIEGL
jgi:hypothetical protein